MRHSQLVRKHNLYQEGMRMDRKPDTVHDIFGAIVKVYNGEKFKWATMTPEEVAADFEDKLASGDYHARELNNALCDALDNAEAV